MKIPNVMEVEIESESRKPLTLQACSSGMHIFHVCRVTRELISLVKDYSLK